MPKPEDNNFVHINPEMFPYDSPMREEGKFTLFQSLAYPVLLWFFDTERNRGTGKTELLAHVMIELARRGKEVQIKDYSTMITLGDTHRIDEHLARRIQDLTKKYYPKHMFVFNQARFTLTYKGRKP